MNEEDLALLISHSTVLADEDIDELKKSEVFREFEGISFKAILDGREEFKRFDELIKTVNLFFKYDVDLYQQLLSFLVDLMFKNRDFTPLNVIYPVIEDIKRMINNTPLYKYLFTGDTTDLRPEDIFRTSELLSSSIQHFEERDFTSEVVAKGISYVTSHKVIEEMFEQSKNYPFVVVYEDLVEASIDRDNVTLLDYLINSHEDKQPLDRIKDIVHSINGYPHYYSCVNYASFRGSLKCLKYLCENGGTSMWDERACSNAASAGNLECLKYLHEIGGATFWNEDTCNKAAGSSSVNGIDCLKYAYENGCPWNKWACCSAASAGNLGCLKYLHEIGGSLIWDEYTYSSAASSNSIECLKYLHENGRTSVWNEKTCSSAASVGNLECLKYAHENGCPWNRHAYSNAASLNSIECLKYLHENGGASLWDEWTCNGSISLECLKYIHENGGSSKWDEWTCSNAALNGHLDCLKYIHENGRPSILDERTCSNAALGGHLDCLKYAHENGGASLWDELTLIRAKEGGSIECLNYVLVNRITFK